ncbi:MAG: DUF1232 domain-containing protein [Acidobacteriota bacterium]
MSDETRTDDLNGDMTDDEVSRAETLAAAVEDAGDDATIDRLPSSGLLSFYDRLRARIERTVAKRGGKMAQGTVNALLMVPDVFMLLMRLALDPEVPRSTRTLIGGALAYFILPIDILPEAFVGPAGYVDDLVLALSVLSQAFGRDLEPWAHKYWSGSQDLRRVIGDVLGTARGLLNDDLYTRLRKILADRGIDLDKATREAAADDGGLEDGGFEDSPRGA